eukprot:scaffold5028_cov381-Prasinococcus_capsulatus_cf.AAC.3
MRRKSEDERRDELVFVPFDLTAGTTHCLKPSWRTSATRRDSCTTGRISPYRPTSPMKAVESLMGLAVMLLSSACMRAIGA